jgi:hypothetical protein
MRLVCANIFLLILLCFAWSQVNAQTDSIPSPTLGKGKVQVDVIKPAASTPISKKEMVKDTSKVVYVHSPKKAALLSAVLPGAGQVYNRKYWKVGIIAGGAGALIYSLNYNNRNFGLFKSELIKRQQGLGGLDADLGLYTDANLNELQDFYRRNRDLSVVGLALLYALNIIDANVDAHLYDFNVSDDLSMHIRPTVVYSMYSPLPLPALGIQFRF